MQTLVTILHVLVCFFLMLTVLLQAGKGGGMGAAFGGGSSMGTVFGGSGAGNFLRRLTVTAAIIFMVTSMTLAWMATPSTDPLKEYWARQQAAATERESAHREAVRNQADSKGGQAKPEAGKGAATTTPGTEGSGEESALDEGAETAPASGAATAPEKGEAEGKAGAPAMTPARTDDKPAADKPADRPAADKSATEPADKPTTDKPAADKPAKPADSTP